MAVDRFCDVYVNGKKRKDVLEASVRGGYAIIYAGGVQYRIEGSVEIVPKIIEHETEK